MIKRLIKIALFAGAAHVFTILTLKFISQQIEIKKISLLGEIDSLFQLIINIIALGLQSSAVRNIASSQHWREVYQETQTARNSFAFFLVPLAALYFIKAPYQYFIFAPIFALSGDYALYGIGRPVSASLMAFFRILIPSMILFIGSLWFQSYIIEAYVIGTVSVYLVTSIVITKWLGTPFWYRPHFNSLILYVKSINLGIVSLNFYFLGLGLLVIASNFYNDGVLAVAYLGLKLYMVFKGILRIINQAFIKEMLYDEVCTRVDQLAIFASLVFAGIFIIFPKSSVLLFFNKDYLQHSMFFQIIGISGVIVAFLTSFTTRSLLKFKDKIYSIFAALAVIAAILVLFLLSFYLQTPLSIGIGLLVGEVVTLIGLLKCNRDINIQNRVMYLLKCMGLLSVPIAIRLVIGDFAITMIVSMAIFIISSSMLFFKRFSDLSILNPK